MECILIFGLEDKFSPKTILTSFLQDPIEAFKKEKREAHNSSELLRKGNEKLLGILKSIVHYFEDRGIDPTDLLGSYLVKEKIVKLEEEIAAELDKTIAKKNEKPKRKLDGMGLSSTVRSEEMKR
ncbi:protein FRIGIDA-like [Hibiscus syriacus]|uniref:protein FRIGIDA-like n=1 Tax=Hibiscus syriacus TaxID=106335 RepID=UPI001921B098|nr:protein FRIGIDA-like [Hibiscus syriacus]